MPYKKTVLVAEDDRDTLNLIKSVLITQDYKVIDALTGEEAIRMKQNYNPDLILLGLDLPDMDGIDMLKEIRAYSQIPVIIVSVRDDEHSKVEALTSGAIDYITMPFSNAELLARVRNIIQLYERLTDVQQDAQDVYMLNGLFINYDAYRITLNGKPVHLTPIEYKIVELLSRHAGKVLTHEQIINQVWGANNCDIQVLRVNMANIRRKIESDPADPRIILTELGVGYQMAD